MASVTNVNGKVIAGNGLGPRTIIASITTGSAMTQAELDGTIQALTMQSAAGAGVSAADAFSVAGIDGAAGDTTIYVALQGTGTLGTDAGDYYAGVTAAAVATFG
jgi:hypothetical protein